MSIEWFLLITDIIENLNKNLGLIFIVSSAFLIVFGYCYFMGNLTDAASFNKETSLKLLKVLKPLSLLTVTLFLLITVLPSKTTLYTIGGIHYAKQLDLPNNPILTKSLTLLEQKLDEALSEKKEK